ncbi:DUF3253 domain-containing protein [Sulfitobacter sp. JB4-11]|uniref:DUF3253 domain-containing protein n=1 Tax=Sulfitobacter rhodophyticola TaxID=3238304 RepID=UPI0035154987
MTPSPADIAAEIARQVAERGAGKTICPSEVARAFGDDWRLLMADVRRVAAQMAARGEIVVTQKGIVVDVETARGPIRLGQA